MSDTIVLSSADALKALQAATRGLLFPSESDKPIKAFLWKKTSDVTPAAGASIDASTLLANGALPPGSTAQSLTTTDFFSPVTADQSWFGAEEKATAQRFRDLEALLNRLAGVTAFRVMAADPRQPITAYALGYTSDGDVAGVTTELVET